MLSRNSVLSALKVKLAIYVQEEVKDVVKKMISFQHFYVLREQPKKRSSNILMKLTVKNQ